MNKRHQYGIYRAEAMNKRHQDAFIFILSFHADGTFCVPECFRSRSLQCPLGCQFWSSSLLYE
jgi:hypothetical protein